MTSSAALLGASGFAGRIPLFVLVPLDDQSPAVIQACQPALRP